MYMIDVVSFERAAEIAFLMFKLIGSITGCFLCIFLIYKFTFSGFGFVIRLRPPQEEYYEEDEDEEDEDKNIK